MTTKTKSKQGIPDTIKVGPFKLTTEEDRDLLELLGGDAALDYTQLRIIYNGAQQGAYLADSILHEALHAIFRITPMYNTESPIKEHEEVIVSSIAPLLLGVLKDNPEFLAFLLED